MQNTLTDIQFYHGDTEKHGDHVVIPRDSISLVVVRYQPLVFVFAFCLLTFPSHSQTVAQKLQKAYQQLESDSQFSHASSSLYVINAQTGEIVFDKNSQTGLAPASTQKIITAATAFELLGKDYRYETRLGYDGETKNGTLHGNLYVTGSGDPTFGSWRYPANSERSVFEKFWTAIFSNNIKHLDGLVIPVSNNWETQTTPDGWIWQDLGNYYGAGASGFDWRENQFDVKLKSSGKIGSAVTIAGTTPDLFDIKLVSEVRAAEIKSGDNAYLYLPPYATEGFIRGTIPIEEDSFKISGALPNPGKQFVYSFLHSLSSRFQTTPFAVQSIDSICRRIEPGFAGQYPSNLKTINNLYRNYSPSLDSVIYWFLQKSINLYGEALLKTVSWEKKGIGSTDSGAVVVKDLWKEKGIDPGELNIKDGSGLSPQNRVTTHAQVAILKYAKQQPWFPYFLSALPEFNNMKMKSGSISDVKAFCGYHTSGTGTQYIFSFIVNNYNGSSSATVSKMYKVLDVLK